jgi:23S rRNA (guanosine2251-2'-O)-methyltransferase
MKDKKPRSPLQRSQRFQKEAIQKREPTSEDKKDFRRGSSYSRSYSRDSQDSRGSRSYSKESKDSRGSRSYSRDSQDSRGSRSHSKDSKDSRGSRSYSKRSDDSKKSFEKKVFSRKSYEPRFKDSSAESSSNPPDNKVFGKNAVIECLNSNVSINKIWLLNVHNPKLKEIETLARAKKIPVIRSPRQELERLSEGEDHRSVVAEICPVTIHNEDFLYEKNNQEKLKKIIIAVNIEDPHNLGAILRSAMAFGIDALIFTARKSTQITSTVISSSAGAALKIPLVRISNTTDSILRLKEHGYWIYGTCADQDNSSSLNKIDFHEKSVVLVGNEGKGLSDKVLKHCDYSVYIPVDFNSLNVSVATGIVLYKMSSSKS